MRTRPLALSVALVVCLVASAAHAEEPGDATSRARTTFLEGAKLVEDAQWAAALERFEESARLRPHPVTTYNVAACLRALGSYTHAKRRYVEALRTSAEGPAADALPAPVKTEVEGLVTQLDGIVAKVDVTLDPVPVKMVVDGRPLLFERADLAIAGVRAPGPAEEVTASRFVVEIDPGVHTVTVQREGSADAVATFTTRSGARTEQAFHLDRLPSTLRIASTHPDTVVRLDDVDVGVAPITLTRPAGPHHVVMLKPGFVTYDSKFATHAGEDLRITGTLSEEKTPITKKWWFWTTVAASLVTVGVVSYAVVRSTQDPEQAPYNGGTLGWTVPAR